MNPLPLQLRRLSAPARSHRPVRGWLLRGGDAGEWLAEIARWKVDDTVCTIHVLPRSRDDLSAGAALVLCPTTPATPPAGVPYASIAGRLYLPTDAELSPAATDQELAELCGNGVLIFHPALGAVYAEHRLTTADLLRGAPELDEPFTEAMEIRRPHDRIEAVGFRLNPDLDDLMEQMRDDIGTEPNAELPPSTNEPKDHPLARGMRKLGLAGLGLAGWLLKPRGGAGAGADQGKSGPLGKMLNWVNDRLQSLSEEVERLRNKSLHRLLDQLKNNPDEALKHALPLAQTGLNRGTAPPSGDLGTRTPDFRLGNLRGGQGADFWNLDAQMREQLRQNYLRLAERERQIGRHRRAAYIYAELLGDLASAAAVLKEGRHWREAALIYRDHLRQPLAAAECFLEARMLNEAVEIYEKERDFEKLGRLYRQLGDEARAARAFQDWIDHLLASQRHREAAHTLLHDLGDRPRALAVLEMTWPDHHDLAACVDEWFALRAQAGEHAEARALILKLGGLALPTGASAAGLKALARLQGTYPDRRVRVLAEDVGRQQVARMLAGHDPAQARDFSRMLPPLCPEDRLLARDVLRFTTQRLPTPKPASPRPFQPELLGEIELRVVKSTQLPFAVTTWRTALAADHIVYAAGTNDDHTLAVSVNVDWLQTQAEWTAPPPSEFDTPLLLAPPAPGFPNALLYHPRTALPLKPLGQTRIGAPAWLSGPVYAAAVGSSALWLLRQTPTGLTLSGHRRDGTLVNQLPIAPILREATPEWQESTAGVLPSLIAFGSELAVAIADHVIVYISGTADKTATAVFDGPILRLVAGPRWAKPHFAAVFRDRVELCWLDGAQLAVHPARAELENPCAGFTTDGTLVIIAGQTGFLIESDSRGRQKRARFKWSGVTPLAILPGPAARTFVVFEPGGRLSSWRFSAEELR